VTTLLIVGLGNPLMGDDGIGAAVVDELLQRGLPPGVRAGVAPDVLHLPSLWGRERNVWLVDAMIAGGPPGTIHVLEHDQILELDDHHGSAHQLSLPESLRWLIHGCPELARVRFRLWGVEPEALGAVSGLTSRVAAAGLSLSVELATAASGGGSSSLPDDGLD
jgi:hydrogenase maturation protease